MIVSKDTLAEILKEVKRFNSTIAHTETEKTGKAQLNIAIKQDKNFNAFFNLLKQGDMQKEEDKRDLLELLAKITKSPLAGKDTGKGYKKHDDHDNDISDVVKSLMTPLAILGVPKTAAAIGTFIDTAASATVALTGFGIGTVNGYLKSHGVDIKKTFKEISGKLKGEKKINGKPIPKTTDIARAEAKIASEKAADAAFRAKNAKKNITEGLDAADSITAAKKAKFTGTDGVSKTVIELEADAIRLRKEADAAMDAVSTAEKIESAALKLQKFKRMTGLTKIGELVSKARSSLVAGFAGVKTSFTEISGITNLLESGPLMGMFKWFGKLKGIFLKFKTFGEGFGKAFAFLESAWYVISGAWEAFNESTDDGAGTIESGFALLMGAGKGALEWIISIPATLANLFKDWVLRPILRLFGAKELDKAFEEQDAVKTVKDAVNKLFEWFSNIGKWIGDKILSFIKPFSDRDSAKDAADQGDINAEYVKLAKKLSVADAKKLLKIRGISEDKLNIAAGNYAASVNAKNSKIKSNIGAEMNKKQSEIDDSKAANSSVAVIAPTSNSSTSVKADKTYMTFNSGNQLDSTTMNIARGTFS